MKKYFKRTLIGIFALVAAMCGAMSLTLFGANRTVKADGGASLEIYSHNLAYADNLYLLCAVKATGVSAQDTELLVWNGSDGSYEKGSESYSATYIGTEEIKGENCYVFALEKTPAKNLVDEVIVRAYADDNGESVYSDAETYSAVRYLNSRLRNDGITENQRELYSALIAYGAAAQKTLGYKTDRLASENYYEIKVVNGKLPNNTCSNAYQSGETVVLTAAAAPAGQEFFAWQNKSGVEVSRSAEYTITVSADETYTAVYREPQGKVIEKVNQSVGAAFIDNSDYIMPTDSSVSVTAYLTDAAQRQGIIALYNEPETLNYRYAAQTYYLFATEGNTAAFYVVFHGNTFNLVKSTDINALSLGEHTYGISINNAGEIDCYLDGAKVLSVSAADLSAKGLGTIQFAGRMGAYFADGENAAESFDVISGGMTLAQVKDYLYGRISVFEAVYYTFNGYTLAITRNEGVVNIADADATAARAAVLKRGVYAAVDVPAVLSAIKTDASIAVDASKAFTEQSLFDAAKDAYDAILMPNVSVTSLEIAGTGVTMQVALDTPDTRWWVPNAYMLYSTWPAPNNEGVMERLANELNGYNSLEEVYGLADKYINDILRATAFKGIEYYYWQEYNKDSQSVYNMWWYLYTYSGAAGDGFAYCGNAFEGFNWNNDYRLNAVLFNPSADGFTTTPQAILDAMVWIIANQTVSSVSYSVNLNPVGGTVSQVSLSGNSASALALPTPVKDGYTFAGWYENRSFEGSALTQIAAGNKKDKRLYARWQLNSQDETLAVNPAPVFGDDMVLQSGEPIKVFGEGIDGTIVQVDFDGETQYATVENGKWEVTLAPRTASFTPKTLTISGGGITYNFAEVLVGEVWLCSGQSNMQMTLSWMIGTGTEYVGQYGYEDNLSKVRIYREKINGTVFGSEPELSDKWAVKKTPNDALSESAYALSFALGLQKQLGVPVGVIVAAVGATYIEEWLSSESIATAGSVIAGTAEEYKESRYYNGMISKLDGVAVSGVVWYQGENNAYAENNDGAPKIYDKQLTALIGQYRAMFGDDTTVIVTELAPYAWDDYKDFRLVQRAVADSIDGVYIVSTVDLGEATDIHPVYKLELGKRAAKIALQYVYGVGTDSLNYIPASATAGEGFITLDFGGKTLVEKRELIGFKVKNSDGALIDASAEIVGTTVRVYFTGTAEKVYYMYGAYVGAPGLYGGNGLPIAPFEIAVL